MPVCPNYLPPKDAVLVTREVKNDNDTALSQLNQTGAINEDLHTPTRLVGKKTDPNEGGHQESAWEPLELAWFQACGSATDDLSAVTVGPMQIAKPRFAPREKL